MHLSAGVLMAKRQWRDILKWEKVIDMPVRQVSKNCYQWGNSGKKYCRKDAKKKAERQALAIRLSGYKKK